MILKTIWRINHYEEPDEGYYWQEHPFQLSQRKPAEVDQRRCREVFGISHHSEVKLRGNGKSVPALDTLKTPLRDGDKERPDDEAYANSYFINANSPHKPGVVDANNNIILDTSELYSGIYGHASINFYAFNSNGNRGIACGLNALQKLRDGDPLGGHVNAETEFAGLDEDDDELSDFLN